ncbi:hypothetical protein [Microbacterium sp.]|uniref:hypothetical protein n=1 Tax=Microbacterium sp. TaxID=51671 RepID=UPI003A94A63E
MDTVTIDAGTLEFSEQDLTATGLLIPFGVAARSNLGTFTFKAGDVLIPEDTTGMSLNIEHRREDVVGGFTRVWEQEQGVMASFAFAASDAGRAAFTDAKNGKRKNLSAEVAGVRIQDGAALPGARLFAGAVCEHPAFEGATLLAAADTETSTSSSVYSNEFTDENGVKWRRVEESTTTTTTTVEPVENTTEADPAEDTEEEGATMAATTTTPGQQTAGTTPAAGTLLAGATLPTVDDAHQPVDLGTVFAAMASIKSGTGDIDAATTLLAALSDIKPSGLSDGVTPASWVGRLWQGRRYQRRWIDALTHLYGGITLGGRKGFKLDQGTALVAKWSGEKSAIGSGTASTSAVGSSRQAYGYAADFAREWWDLDGGAEVIQAFFDGVVDSYAKITDTDALTAVFDAASKTAAALDRLVAPDVISEVGGRTFPDAMGALIQGIEAIEDADDSATFAFVNPVAWKQLVYTPKDMIPEYVQFQINAGEGGTADGKVGVRRAPSSAFVGLDATKPQTIVGARSAIEFREQGQTPIQIDALDIAKGGVDRAVIGYLETFVVRPESLVLIGTKAA